MRSIQRFSDIHYDNLNLLSDNMVLTRRTVTSLFLVLLLVGAAAPLSQGNSSGNTGASCSCHGAAGSSVTITLEGLVSDMWSPSTTYRLFVNASSSIGVSKGGFSLAVDAGSLSGVSGSSQRGRLR